MKNLPDDIDGVSYRTQPRSWMDNNTFLQWLQEPRAICKDPDGRSRTIFLGNCSGHRLSDPVLEALNNISTSLKFLPPNATHLCQPLDSFILQKLKSYWRKQWETKKIELIRDNQWSAGPRSSGKLPNPGKRFYMSLAAESVGYINSMVDNDGMRLVRKAMIRCGLSLNSTGL